MILCITGTNTNVGKTIATAALAAVYRQRGHAVTVVKPAQTGEPAGSGDLATIARLLGEDEGVNYVEFARYPDPLAPRTAALHAGMPMLDRDEVVEQIRALDAPERVVLVEGAGGLLVELGEFTLVDVAQCLDAPVLLVTHTQLGALNAAALTTTVLVQAKVACVGLIAGSYSAAPELAERLNLEDLPRVTGVPLLGVIPEGVGQLAPDVLRAEAATWVSAPALSAALG